MNSKKRELGEVWKENGLWYVQFPRGRDGFKRKKSAVAWSKVTVKTE